MKRGLQNFTTRLSGCVQDSRALDVCGTAAHVFTFARRPTLSSRQVRARGGGQIFETPEIIEKANLYARLSSLIPAAHELAVSLELRAAGEKCAVEGDGA